MKKNRYYISRNYKSLFNAAGKAKTDCESILNDNGFKNLGFKQSSIPNSALGTIKNFLGITLALIRLPYKSILCTQYPNNKFRKYILFVAKLKKNKIITIVHDVRSLKGRTKDIKKELSKIITTDVIIVHNEAMKNWFIEQDTTIPIIVLEIFDYLSDNKPSQNDSNFDTTIFNIAYAGGLNQGKNGYIYNLDTLKLQKINMKLYGIGFEPDKLKVKEQDSIIDYQGAFPSDVVAHKIVGSFGLVWDGMSTETCSGKFGEYLKFNNPHKTSLYLLSGLPIIIWDKAAIAPFIVKNNVGIAISDLKNLDNELNKISKDNYIKMKENVIEMQAKLMAGQFLNTAIYYAEKAI